MAREEHYYFTVTSINGRDVYAVELSDGSPPITEPFNLPSKRIRLAEPYASMPLDSLTAIYKLDLLPDVTSKI